jgi:large subunit ribosomal protein L11
LPDWIDVGTIPRSLKTPLQPLRRELQASIHKSTLVEGKENHMAKKIAKQFKVLAPGGQATPAPPLGPALGANGVNPGQFIQMFNDRTRELNGKVVGCIITLYSDRSFDIEIKSSPAAVLLRTAAGIEKGSGVPHTEIVGSVTKEQVKAIAEEKMEDLNTTSIESAMRIIEGTARSMGVTVEGN